MKNINYYNYHCSFPALNYLQWDSFRSSLANPGTSSLILIRHIISPLVRYLARIFVVLNQNIQLLLPSQHAKWIHCDEINLRTLIFSVLPGAYHLICIEVKHTDLESLNFLTIALSK